MSNTPATHAAFEIKYGELAINVADLPVVSQVKLLTSGLAHVLGNEVASQVNGFFRAEAAKALEATLGRPLTPDERKAVKATEPAGSADYVAKATEYREAKLTALRDGTIGEASSRGPAKDPVEAKFDAIVKTELVAILRNQKIHTDRKDPTDETVYTFADGQTRSYESFRRGYAAKHGERVRKEAEKAVAAEAAKRAKAAQSELDF